MQGPQLNNSLIGVLFRFRKEEIDVASDIESTFHRVGCVERDTDALISVVEGWAERISK